MPITKAVFRSIARRCAAQELVPHRFNQVTGLGYVRHSSPVIQYLDVQIDSYEPSYTINFGFHYDWARENLYQGPRPMPLSMSLVDFVLRSRLSHLRSSGELYRDQWWKFCDSRQAAQRSCRELLQESRELQERFLDRWRDPAALLEDVPPQRLRNDALFYAKYSRAERLPEQAPKTLHTSFDGLAGWYYVELTSFAYVLAQSCKRSGRMRLMGEYVQEGLLGIKECPTDALRDEHARGRLLALLET